MKKLDENDCKVMDTFLEYYNHLNSSKVTEGVQQCPPEQAQTLNMFIAACLTIKKEYKKEVEDPFA